MDSFNFKTPVFVYQGAYQGPNLCLFGTLHGDELNGIEIIRQLLNELELDSLYGTVIGVPIVNMDGFRRDCRYMTSRKDLNRAFPGSPEGHIAERLAHYFYTGIASHCDYIVDIHTGSLHR